MSATVERAVRLGEEVTLLACRAADTDDAPPPVPGRQDDEVLCIRCEDLLVLAVAIPADSTELEIATGAAAVKTFARDYLAPAGAATRDRIVEALSQTMRWQDPHPLALAESLRLLRDGLRESAIGARDRTDGAALTAEYVALVDRDHLYVRGWLRDPDGAVTGLTAIAPEGGRVSLLDGAYRYSRPDVGGRSALGRRTKNGFIASRRLPAPSLLAEGWLFEVEIAGEPTIEVPAPKVATDALAIRDTVLDDAFTGYLPSDDLMREHVSPAVNRIQDLIQAEAEVESVIQLGEPPADPSVSIVIPLYQHLDHLKFQLSQFADDADMAGADLIYVLDSPDQVEELGEAVRQLFPIYRVPLRVCITGANLGFAGASNAGASIARSDLLLMMNSDVLPDTPGWLRRLMEFYRDTPGCDVLGPEAPARGREHPTRRDVPAAVPGIGRLARRALLQGARAHLPGRQRAAPRARRLGSVPDGRSGAVRGPGRLSRLLRARRLRGLRPLRAGLHPWACELVLPRGRALPPRGTVLRVRAARPGEQVQRLAAHAHVGRRDRAAHVPFHR